MRTALLAALAAVVLAGCSGAAKEETAQNVTSALPAGVVAHRDAAGKLVCPVMNKTIASEKDAVSYQDYEGQRYYFCCGMCPDKFKADPAKYVRK